MEHLSVAKEKLHEPASGQPRLFADGCFAEFMQFATLHLGSVDELNKSVHNIRHVLRGSAMWTNGCCRTRRPPTFNNPALLRWERPRGNRVPRAKPKCLVPRLREFGSPKHCWVRGDSRRSHRGVIRVVCGKNIEWARARKGGASGRDPRWWEDLGERHGEARIGARLRD